MMTTRQVERIEDMKAKRAELAERIARCERVGDEARAADYRQEAQRVEFTLALMTMSN